MIPDNIDSVVLNFNSNAQLLLTILLVMIMFGVALNIRLSDFSFIKHKPVQFSLALCTQLIALPALTLLVTLLLPLPASIELGLIIVACCPSGITSNAMTLLARGDVAFSVSLTAFCSVIGSISTAFSILFWSGLNSSTASLVSQLDIDTQQFLLQTSLILFTPLLAGILVRHFFPTIAIKLARYIAPFSMVALIGFAVIIFYIGRETFLEYGIKIVPLVAVHNLLAIGLGILAGYIILQEQGQRRALSFEIAIQNTGLGLVILVSQFKGLGGAALVTAVWGLWHFIGGFALIGFYRWVDRKTKN